MKNKEIRQRIVKAIKSKRGTNYYDLRNFVFAEDNEKRERKLYKQLKRLVDQGVIRSTGIPQDFGGIPSYYLEEE